jgi:hypothetical protein
MAKLPRAHRESKNNLEMSSAGPFAARRGGMAVGFLLPGVGSDSRMRS